MSVLLQQAEKTCQAIAGWLEQPSGSLNLVSDEFSRERSAEIRKVLEEARLELARSAAELDLAPAVVSQRRAVVALLAKLLSDLEELKSPALRAYGVIAPETEQQVDAYLARMHAIFERMAELCVKP